MKIQIKHSWTGSVLFELTKKNNSLKITLEAGVKAGANLNGANLNGASLNGANLNGASLNGASLDGANLDGASLYRANLAGASLAGANLAGANLDGASLAGVKNITTFLWRNNLSILKQQTGKLIAYKYLYGNKSPYQDFEYVVGQTYSVSDYDTDELKLCASGLNVATLEWCLRNTNCDLGKTYVQCEFNAKDIIAVPFNTDGKFRVKKLKIVKKLSKKQIEKFLKSGEI